MNRAGHDERRAPTDAMKKALLESLEDAACCLDTNAEVTLANAQFQTLSRAAKGPPTLTERLAEPISRALTIGEAYRANISENLIRLRIGDETRAFQPSIQPITVDGDTIVGAAVLLKDVTEFDLLGQVKSDLIATFNHEINTPATSIRMAIQLLLEQQVGSINRGQFELLKLAEQDVDRMLRTLRNLLDLNRFSPGAHHIHLEWEAPAKLVDLAVKDTAPHAQKRNQTIATSLPEDLPRVRVDRARIVHSLSNIVHNAIKYSNIGDEIRITAAVVDDYIKLSIHDDGPGIPSEFAARIFDRYVTIPQRAQNGPGLGLSVAREFVEAHGGKVGVDSDGARGSEFYITLPIQTRDEE